MATHWKNAFRERMKQEGWTFPRLAKELEMSVPGVKKIFQKDDISLERFKQICRILDLSAVEIMEKESRRSLKIKSLSKEADAYLSKEQRAFYLYWLLVNERLTVEEALRALALSKGDGYRMLRQLDRFGLVEWHEEDEIQLPDNAPFVFGHEATCVVKFARENALALVRESFDSEPSPDAHLFLRYLNISPEKLAELMRQLTELADSVAKKHPPVGRKSAKANGLVPAQLLLCLRPGEMRLGK